jgi:hypothetical protein
MTRKYYIYIDGSDHYENENAILSSLDPIAPNTKLSLRIINNKPITKYFENGIDLMDWNIGLNFETDKDCDLPELIILFNRILEICKSLKIEYVLGYINIYNLSEDMMAIDENSNAEKLASILKLWKYD